MARPKIYSKAKRINIILEAEIHDIGVRRASEHRLSGGFSEYVARLIKADRRRKGRAIMSARRAA